MFGVDDEVAGRERGEFGEEGVGGLLALLAVDEAIAEHVLLGEHRDVGRGEAVIEGEDDQRDGGRGDAERLLPGVDLLERR